jgi:anti-sigma regulatory factor (Ser/Thr protein kinase)
VEARVIASAPIALDVHETSQVGAARREAMQLARSAGLDEGDAGRAGLIATELATNLCRHARSGQLLLRHVADPSGVAAGVEIVAIDRGPGMADVERCLADGYSSGATPGTGLGAIRRAASEFDIHSSCPNGTVLAVRVTPRSAPAAARALAWGAVSVAIRGESICGDAFAVVDRGDDVAFLVADGLGHGPLAADAARLAVEVLHAAGDAPPMRILELAHQRMRGTRGAAVAIGTVARTTGAMRYAAVGNISARILDADGSRSLISWNGTVGVQMAKPKEVEAALPPGALLVVHSDGLVSRWDLAKEPRLLRRDPAVVAGALFRDHSRGSDDATVLVGRRAPTSPAGGT